MRWESAAYRWNALAEAVILIAGPSVPAQSTCNRRCRCSVPTLRSVRAVIDGRTLTQTTVMTATAMIATPAPVAVHLRRCTEALNRDRVWMNDTGYRSYHCGLTMLATVHIICGLPILATVHSICDRRKPGSPAPVVPAPVAVHLRRRAEALDRDREVRQVLECAEGATLLRPPFSRCSASRRVHRHV